MITGEIKNQIDRIWDAFWAGGIANPIEALRFASSVPHVVSRHGNQIIWQMLAPV